VGVEAAGCRVLSARAAPSSRAHRLARLRPAARLAARRPAELQLPVARLTEAWPAREAA